MPHNHVFPAWAGGLLSGPWRRLVHKPERILGPFVRTGMTVLDVGPGMGFFSLPLARMVGPEGRVVCVDVQEGMLQGLRKRARAAHLEDRLVLRLAQPVSLGLADFEGRVESALAFAVVHEMPDAAHFFAELARLLKPDAVCLFAETKGPVSADDFARELDLARQHGFASAATSPIARSHAALLTRT